MKFKGIFGALIAIGTMVLMAVGVHAGDYSVGIVPGTPGETVKVPVELTPAADKDSATVTAYTLSFKYDNEALKPVLTNTDGDGTDTIHDMESLYAYKGDEAFSQSDQILVSDTKDNGDGTSTLIIAWASPTPVVITETTELVNVEFEIDQNASGSHELEIVAATVVKDADNEDEPVDVDAASGRVDLDLVLRGDANASGEVTIADVQRIYQYLLGKADIDNLIRGDANSSGEITIADAQRISLYLLGKATIEN